MPNPDANELLRRYKTAKGERFNWETHWQLVADYVLPTRSFTTERSRGSMRRDRIFDDTAPRANESLAAAIHGLLVPQSSRFFALKFPDYGQPMDEAGMAWAYDSTSRLLAYLASSESGWPVASHELCLDLGAFGTGVNLMRRTPSTFTYQARELSDFFITHDDHGRVREVFRRTMLTNREAWERWGEKNSEAVQRCVNDARSGIHKDKLDEKREYVHVVYPRKERIADSITPVNMPVASLYIDVQAKKIVSESGLRHWPYLSPRWSVAPGETYGRSPSMTVLPSILTVNAMTKTLISAGEMAVHPPINVPANSVVGNFSALPGAKNYYKRGTRDLAAPMITGVNIPIGKDLVEMFQKSIEAAYFLDAFKLPDIDRMTREEVITRRQQGLLLASPALARLYTEWLNPAIIGLYGWMLDTGRLLPPPPSVRGREMTIEYVSAMAASQRQSDLLAFETAMRAITPIAQIDPGALDHLDTDFATRDLIEASGLNPKYMRPRRSVEQRRAAAAQQQAVNAQTEEAALAAQAARDGAAALRDVSRAGSAA